MDAASLTVLLIEIRLRCGNNRALYDAAIARLKQLMERSVARQPNAPMGMVGDEFRGPQPPDWGEWVKIKDGPRGGNRWQKVSKGGPGQEPQDAVPANRTPDVVEPSAGSQGGPIPRVPQTQVPPEPTIQSEISSQTQTPQVNTEQAPKQRLKPPMYPLPIREAMKTARTALITQTMSPEAQARVLQEFSKMNKEEARLAWSHFRSYIAIDEYNDFGGSRFDSPKNGKAFAEGVAAYYQYSKFMKEAPLEGETDKDFATRMLPQLSNFSHLDIKDINHQKVRSHVYHLSLLPENIVNAVNNSGTETYVGKGSVLGLDDMKNVLAGTSATDKGFEIRNWEDVGGVMSYKRQADQTVERRNIIGDVGKSGSASTALHETGHVLGSLGLDYSDQLTKIHKEVYEELTPYLQQQGPGSYRGRQELLAEGFATYMKYGEETCRDEFGEKFTKWLKGRLKAIK